MNKQKLLSMDELHARANEIYAQRKLRSNYAYKDPELRPTIQSDQVLAMFEVLYGEIEKLSQRMQ